ncbi:MAG: nitrilase family protein [Flavobacteriales bacterium MED-G22]|nr:MAG: nitrilase family protein [Flavobacteriales bacterium MED-G22]|tara:strand:+ start:44 stop:835 length:792 start_codon:yes stop_codon:yes gene_type:complete
MGKDRQELLKVALLQINSVWHQPEKNRILLSQEIAKIGTKTDLVLLPEMFTTGFSMAPKKLAETMEGQTVQWMRSLAKEFNTVIAGSVIIEEEGFFFNRFLWVPPKDTIAYYDKRHGFSLVGEHLKYKAGENSGLVNYKGWKICLRICYDLRFPVWCRNTEEYDLLLFVANWPKPRMQAWDTLLKARAIENMAYCCGVNIVGEDPKGNQYLGHSAGYDCFGNRLTGPLSEKKEAIWVPLDYQALQAHRKQFRFLEDRDNFELR